MNILPRMDIADLPDSPHARELRRGRVRLRFDEPLEGQYLAERLGEVKLRVRTFAALALVLAVAMSIEKLVRDGGFTVTVLVYFVLALPLIAAILVVSLTRWYERVYVPMMEVGAPVLAGLATVLSAESVAAGSAEDMVIVVLLMPALFLFMGLLFRTALNAAVLVLVVFVVAGLLFPVPGPVYAKGILFLAVAGAIAAMISRDVELLQRRRFLEESLIGELLERDALTGLKNRRALDTHLESLWRHCAREERSLGLLFVDIDHFKAYNDLYGHQAGDVTLRRVADVTRAIPQRGLDIAARFGGEEFCVLLYDATAEGVADSAERLREAVQQLRMEHRDSPVADVVTISVGAAVVQPSLQRSPAGALQLADEALYRAKEAGRNNTVVLGADEYAELHTGVYGTAGRGHH
jgi:diguanylate cyclase (GGDEF)-like protein